MAGFAMKAETPEWNLRWQNAPAVWYERFVCSACASRDVDMVVTGIERR